jgi:tetratricopeptide (TPR) repeat protein
VAQQARRVGLPDADRLSWALRGGVLAERGDLASAEDGLARLMQVSRRLPGHLYETTAARILVEVGRLPEAAALLDRMLAPALAASGPRWLGAITELCVVAAATGDTSAAAQLYDALLPYQGQLVVWGGANSTNGPASYYLGLLATRLGRPDDAIGHLTDAIGLAEKIGALPALAHSLVALSAALTGRAGPGDIDRAADLIVRARDLADRLGLTRLQQRLDSGVDEWTLRTDADGWLLEAGDERVRLPDTRGLHHLRALLAAPRADIAALDLAAGGRGLEPEGAAPHLDNRALASYRRRLEVLTAELDGADAAGDAERAKRADAERQAVLAELRRATGLGGRARRTSAESERARINVTRTLQAVLRRIDAEAPKAGAHLRASIRTGLACRYDPAPGGPERWGV